MEIITHLQKKSILILVILTLICLIGNVNYCYSQEMALKEKVHINELNDTLNSTEWRQINFSNKIVLTSSLNVKNTIEITECDTENSIVFNSNVFYDDDDDDEEEEEEEGIKVYFDNENEFLIIKNSIKFTIEKIYFYNSTGHLVYEKSKRSSEIKKFTMPLNFKTGIYIVQFRYNQNLITKRILIK